mmetsp:Transcript_12166/g.25781  ORF Transcript_12166/g.25781 Transcript_12166/m.25781 type:complete len:318 (+) Transcript_12166:680-1633(+)|eukprot:CAMPEP_0201127044 /NCGR_PEP_ID=MMETSP0850-20130426/28581_1 /ASSEMBLY_ACC=CAM_ASM_000622 /TAXON_ID=183588 /ORGANISM="Pseudo-nitzschia fraudulenta, Strain WWA7" /LENGTH=317 /DNA_ID=CAMNT_0047395731 /DNA_START=559 /DNA_END=1512 /DNA_ORIENTATION=+
MSSPQEEWTKQGESCGRYDFTIYYKVEDGARLTCRIESPVPSSLLVPLLSVLNESALYGTWIPSWQTPFRLGVQESKQILHDSRGHQVIQVSVSVPWPMKPREALFSVQAVDDIESSGSIIAKMTTIDDTEQGKAVKKSLPDNFEVPRVSEGMERCDFGGIVLFRKCATDHPNYKATRQKFPEEDLILLQYMMHFDAKMTMVPKSMINFVTRTALGVVWNMLLRVAEQVRDGSRDKHRETIARKADFYNWVEERCKYILHNATTNDNGHISGSDDTKLGGAEQQQQIQQEQHYPINQHSESEQNKHWTLQEVLRMTM